MEKASGKNQPWDAVEFECLCPGTLDGVCLWFPLYVELVCGGLFWQLSQPVLLNISASSLCNVLSFVVHSTLTATFSFSYLLCM